MLSFLQKLSMGGARAGTLDPWQDIYSTQAIGLLHYCFPCHDMAMRQTLLIACRDVCKGVCCMDH